MRYLLIGLIGIIIIGCNQQYPENTKPLIEIEPECTEWTICTTQQNCVGGLDPGQAQTLFDILTENNIKIGAFKCQEKIQQQPYDTGLTIKQVYQ